MFVQNFLSILVLVIDIEAGSYQSRKQVIITPVPVGICVT